jgi:galactokinase
MSLVNRFQSLGFGEEDARARAALMTTVEERFAAGVGQPAAWRFWVPGRLELFGKHTDYAGGRSLVAAVPRGLALAAGPRSDGRVHVIDARRRAEVSIDPVAQPLRHEGWATYMGTVIGRLATNFPGASLGADVVFASDLPSAAGLSSSSALIVGMALALSRRAGLEGHADWRRHIRTRAELAGYLGAVEAGASFGELPGTSGVGTHGGSEDHTAILTGRAGMASLYRYVPVRHLMDVAMPAGWTCVIATSGVHADKIGRARERFNRASAAVRELVEIWTAVTGEPAASLADALASGPDARARLAAAVRRRAAPGFSPADLDRRLEHFVREDRRVPDAAQALAAGEADSIGSLSLDSQREAETLLGNQVRETVDLAAAAREAGAFAASSFGAGFGGSVWALVSAEDAARFGPAWVAQYRRRQPQVRGVEWFEARPSPAAAEIADREI